MTDPRSHQPRSSGRALSATDEVVWSAQGNMPTPQLESSLIPPDADTWGPVDDSEVVQLMNRLTVVSAQLKAKQIVVPLSVSHLAIERLVEEWTRDRESVVVHQSSSTGDIFVRSKPKNDETESYFVVLSSDRIPLSAGPLPPFS